MKANVPEKIYLSAIDLEEVGCLLTELNDRDDVEYTRTDAFIEKAERYIRSVADGLGRDDDVEAFINEFKKYMKGE